MERNVVSGALLLFILVVGAIFVCWLYLDSEKDDVLNKTSDSKKFEKITIAMDSWIGYHPLCSEKMQQNFKHSGWKLECEDDNANYPQRMKRLKNKEIQFAVVTVDSYILNAAKYDFPGTIILVVDESKGGDAILARQDAVQSFDDLKSKSGIKVAFTPNSPSHHLLKATSDHFSVPNILPKDENRIETNGSEQALKELLSGRAQVAALWEPDVTKADSQPGIIKLIGTEDTRRLIVDILVVERSFSVDHPALIKQLLSSYFQTLKYFKDNPLELKKSVKAQTKMADQDIDTMLKGVEWKNLTQNCKEWFGISMPGETAQEGLVATINSTVRIQTDSQDFSTNPLPNEDPYKIILSSYIQSLYMEGMTGFVSSTSIVTGEAKFSKLDELQWQNLHEVGTLKMEPIAFQFGASELDFYGKTLIDDVAEKLSHYGKFRIIIKGHTGPGGDEQVNKQLSQDRAEAVTRYLNITYGIDENRIHAQGFGSGKPLVRLPKESKRSWEYRQPRVEICLAREEL